MQRDNFGHNGLDQIGAGLRQIIEQRLNIVLTDQFAGIFINKRTEMGRNHGFGGHDNIIIGFGFGLLLVANPNGIHAECRVFDRLAVKLNMRVFTRNGELTIGEGFVFADNRLPDANAILVGFQ